MSGNGAGTGLAEDYEAIEKAVLESKRGRWFLEEYARRQRSAETRTMLEALIRLENVIHRREAAPDPAMAAHLRQAAREIAARSQALRKIAEAVADETRRRLASEADALQLLALSYGLLRQRLYPFGEDEASHPLPSVATEISPEQLKFFADEEDLFEPAVIEPLPESSAPEPVALPPDEPEAEPDLPEEPGKNRIVIIRYPAGEQLNIPLQSELAPTG
jgi:hypothetical protein